MAILGVGTEIVECIRIRRMLETHGEAFLERVYTDAEVETAMDAADPAIQLAIRWVAKEATMRAFQFRRRGVRWVDIEIAYDRHAGPTVELHGEAKKIAKDRNVGRIFLSVSACRTHATAHVVATDQDG